MFRLIFILIAIFIKYNAGCQSVVIRGKFENGKNRKVTLFVSRDDDIVFSKNTSLQRLDNYETKSDKNGEFEFKVDNVQGLLYFNYINLGSKKVYIAFEPKDSITITEKDNKLVFNGNGSQKNYFVNFYYGTVVDKRNSWKNNMDKEGFPIDTLIHKTYLNYLADLEILDKFRSGYSIDYEFVKIYREVLKYHFYNDFFISTRNNLSLIKNRYSSLVDSFNYDNEILKLDCIYHSALSGFLDYRLFEQKHVKYNNCKEVKDIIEYSNSILSEPLKDYHWSYIIGYNLWICNNKNNDLKNVINDYLVKSNVQELKEKIRAKAKYKRVID
jgi:hypothetical protein